jgi:hypothetical protein
MRHREFEHAIQAADIVKDEIVVVGSQAVLGQFADAPDSLLKSLEVDVFLRGDPRRADEIDGAMGDGSPFHETYGYYAHGVGPRSRDRADAREPPRGHARAAGRPHGSVS